MDFIECHTLVHIKSVEDVFDVERNIDSILVIAQFLDREAALAFRDMLADTDTVCHGDRLAIVSVHPEQATAIVDVMVVQDLRVS